MQSRSGICPEKSFAKLIFVSETSEEWLWTLCVIGCFSQITTSSAFVLFLPIEKDFDLMNHTQMMGWMDSIEA
jgi:hypothetical protein